MRVRIKLNNHNDKLRPGSLVDVTLFGLPKDNVLTVPTEALILTGRENRVVVQRSDTSFASVPVKIGMMADGRAEILEGLNEHEYSLSAQSRKWLFQGSSYWTQKPVFKAVYSV